MKRLAGIRLSDSNAVYSGVEGALWELIMGQQIHIGGMKSSLDLAERAGIGAGVRGVDLCCCNGAGMRVLVRFRGVASMTGVDATSTVVELGRSRCNEEGLDDRISFVLGDACASGLLSGQADFVWGENAWWYVDEKPRLVAEAARLARPGGVIAFTDRVEGPACLSDSEAERVLRFMKFPTPAILGDYRNLLERNGCVVREASDTGRFAPYLDLYEQMADMPLTYDALRVLQYDTNAVIAVGGEMAFLRALAHEGKIAQGRFVAQKS